MPIAAGVDSEFKPALAPDLTGGINTKSPTTSIPPNQSPDLENVTLQNGAVGRRAGLPPYVRTLPKLNSVVNRGVHGRAIENISSFDDIDYLTVAGAMYAGNRQIQNAITAEFTIEFFLRIDDLTEEHGGNGTGSAPYQIAIRPILFKGPVKKTGDIISEGPTSDGTAMRWATTAQPRWGLTTADYAMPYGIYLENSGAVGNPFWRFRFALHERIAGDWTLRVATSTITPRVGGVYHIIAAASFSQDVITLRIGELGGPLDTVTYDTQTQSLTTSSTPAITTGPIQVFDCPQEFTDSPTLPNATRPPGLDLPGFYFFGAKRFEGAIEDITMHQGDLITGSLTALDRTEKYDPCDLPSTVRQFWSMTEVGDGYVEEMVGYGNHLFFAPSGPIYDPIDGSPRPTGSWWFNGITSYVLASTAFNPNWRWFVGKTDSAAWQTAVRNNMPHGLEITVWPDMIDPLFEQVLIEAHSALRIAIEKDGTIVGYARDDSTNQGSINQPKYQSARVKSTLVVQEGTRYTIALLRTKTTVDGDTLQLFVNGLLEDTNATLVPADQDGQPVGGMTVGMGAYRFTTWTDDIATPILESTPSYNTNDIQTDHRSGFMGRIESFRVLSGSATEYARYKDDLEEDYRYQQSRLWETPDQPTPAVRDDIIPDDPNDLVANVGHGSAAAPSGDTQGFMDLRYLINPTDASPAPSNYILPAAAPHSHSLRDTGDGGMDTFAREVLIYHTLDRWVLNFDDRDVNDAGRHHPQVEIQINQVTGANLGMFKGIHVQGSRTLSELNVLGPLQKRCAETDWQSEVEVEFSLRSFTDRLRPYWYASPSELRPHWGEGLAFPRTGMVETTLLADWENEESGERFVITAAGRQLYWARPPWRTSTPFCGDTNDTRVTWSHGSRGSRLEIPGTSSNQELSGSVNPSIEVWFYPQRADGLFLVCFKGDPATSLLNFMAWFDDGVLHILGTMGGSAAWHVAGSVNQTHIKVNAWNFLAINLNSSPLPNAAINGENAALAAVATFDIYDPTLATQNDDTLYLMGLPAHQVDQTITHNAGADTTIFTLESMRGYMTEYRQRTVPFPVVGVTLIMPAKRFVDDGNTWYLLHLNEGDLWYLTESAANSAGNDGTVELDDLVLVHENLEESTGSRYNFVVYRDQLVITNGRSNPHRIAFRRFSFPGNVFRVRRLGIQQPALGDEIVFTPIIGSATHPAGTYDFWMAFLDADGVDSEPLFLGSFAAPAPFDGIDVRELPRSPDPQVTGRRFWMTASGGSGVPLQNIDQPDNISRDATLVPGTVGQGVEATGRRQPAPRGKHLAVSQGSMWLANLADIPAGQNAFRLSDGFEISFWPGTRTQLIDSEDGKPITAVRGHLGRTYLFKRDSIWQAVIVGNLIAIPSNINKSIGLAGGVTNYDNVLYGAGDKGVHLFTSADVHYASMALEGDYVDLFDIADEALELFYGSYFWPDSQYWLSVREVGRSSNRLIYVMQTDRGTQINQTPQAPWTKLLVPDHTYMETIIDSETHEPILLLGTTSGQILRLNRNELVDAAPAVGTLTGTATATSSTSLTLPGAAFDVINYGLKGAAVTIFDPTTGLVLGVRTIESNTATVLTWLESLAGLPQAPTFEVGRALAQWSSGWMAPQPFGHFARLGFVDLQTDPNPHNLILKTVGAIGTVTTQRTFPSQFEQHSVDMTDGWNESPTRTRDLNRGRYLRIRFELGTPLQPFSVSAWQARARPSGQRGGKTRV